MNNKNHKTGFIKFGLLSLIAILLLFCIPLNTAGAGTIRGKICNSNGEIIPWAFVVYTVQTNTGVYQSVAGSINYPPNFQNPPIEGGFYISWNDADLAAVLGSSTIVKEYLMIQPPEPGQGYGVYQYQPRVYIKPAGVNSNINIKLVKAATFLIKAYDNNGNLMRWKDFINNGLGGQNIINLVNLNDETKPAVVWPVNDDYSRSTSNLFNDGLPAVIVDLSKPGPYALNVISWTTKDYGKLLLKAGSPDLNATSANYGKNQGWNLPVQSENYTKVIELNTELAKTAVADIIRRQHQTEGYYYNFKSPVYDGDWATVTEYKGKTIEQVTDALLQKLSSDPNSVLAEALRIRDELEFKAAKNAIQARKGSLDIEVKDANGNPVANSAINVKQVSHDHSFMFGMFVGIPEGSPDYFYRTSANRIFAYKKAREAGFELTTIIPSWRISVENENYNPTNPSYYYLDYAHPGEINRVWGIHKENPQDPNEPDGLTEMGFHIKLHGSVFLYPDFMVPYVRKPNGTTDIIQNRDGTYNFSLFQQDIMEQQQSLLGEFKNDISIWEAMNEPSYTNCIRIPRNTSDGTPSIHSLLASSARNIKEAKPELPSLINSAHELDFGMEYFFYGLNSDGSDPNQLYSDFKDHYYNTTYSDFLAEAQNKGNLNNVNIVGLQFYSGSHTYNGGDGPAMTPSWLVDTAQNYYDRFCKAQGRKFHITEMSVPSQFNESWKSGYWKNKWDPQTQADYVEEVFTLMFANPNVNSILWWDFLDIGAFISDGGFFTSEKNPQGEYIAKPVYERIKNLTDVQKTGATDSSGEAQFNLLAGEYEVTIQAGTQTYKKTVRINEQTSTLYAVGNTNSKPVANNQTISLNEDSYKNLVLTATDADTGDTLTYSIVTVPAHGSLSGTAPSLTYTPASNYNGSDSFTFKANDGKADSNVATVYITVNAVNDAPSAPSGLTGSALDSNRISLSWAASSDVDNGDVVKYNLYRSSSLIASAISGTSYTDTGLTANTTYTYQVEAVDNAGAKSAKSSAKSITTPALPNNAPVLAAIGNKTVDEGSLLSFVVSATDSDGDTLTYSAAPLPSGASFNTTTKTFSWTPGSTQSGTYSVTFSVSDGKGGSDSEAISITVNDVTPVNVAPRIDSFSVSPTSGTRTLEVNCEASASDANGDTLSYSWNMGNGTTKTGSSFTYQYSPSFSWWDWLVKASKSYTITLTVSDGKGGTDTRSQGITIRAR